MSRIKMAVSVFVSMFLMVSAFTPLASAGQPDVCKGRSNSTICQKFSSDPEGDTSSFFDNVVNTLLFVLGAIAIIVIVVGGIRYATANGDQSAIKQAKDTILYAVVGLVVALFAYAIVGFVVGRI